MIGDNGVLTQSQQAAKKTNASSELETVQFAVAGSFNDEGNLDLDTLVNNLTNEMPRDTTTIVTTNNNFPVIVRAKHGMYTIDGNGKAEKTSGVSLNQSVAKLVKDNSNTINLTATLSDDMQGQPIVWEIKGDNKDSLELDPSTATGENMTVKLKATGVNIGNAIVEAKAQNGEGQVGICTVKVVGSINDAVIGETAIATLVSSGLEEYDNTNISLVPDNEVEGITYSIESGDAIASLTSNKGEIHLNKITEDTATVVVKLKGDVTGIEKEITINVVRQLTALERLTLGSYVTYIARNPDYDENIEDSSPTMEIPCRVLYNDINGDNMYGLQIISNSSVRNVELGVSYDPNHREKIAKAKYDYNNAIEIFNTVAEEYENNYDNGLTLDSRCVGSVSTVVNNLFENKNDETGIDESTGNKGADIHYGEESGTDFQQLGVVGIRDIRLNYWLASRDYYNGTCFIRFVSRDNGSLSRNWLIDDRGVFQYYSYGFRPVFLLKQNIKIKSGTGISTDPFVLEVDTEQQ